MKELNPFLIDDDTKPSYETDVAKWFLIKRGEAYAAWRWDSKKDKDHKQYLLTDIKSSKVVAEDHLLEGILTKFDVYEKAKEE